ncbi:MAG: thiamine pyrophosphate-dependent enzyme, partial [Candidatus Margulisiibacteriota bacterium]
LTHAIRRNPNITCLVHNNMVYGLTKGQASPTSGIGFKTPIQIDGVFEEPYNPIALAIALDASFVARAYCADMPRTVEILKKAISHKGFSLVDIFQPCVSFNKVNTYRWFNDRIYYIDPSHDPKDRERAFKLALEKEKLPLGVFYTNPGKKIFEENLPAFAASKDPLYKRQINKNKLAELIDSKKK